MEAKKFTEWVAENHYRLYDVIGNIYYWKNEYELKTTDELYLEYLKQ